MFSNLESLVEAILSFPYSNVEAERVFSIVTDVKNKKEIDYQTRLFPHNTIKFSN